jgi:hypothetical protein
MPFILFSNAVHFVKYLAYRNYLPAVSLHKGIDINCWVIMDGGGMDLHTLKRKEVAVRDVSNLLLKRLGQT